MKLLLLFALVFGCQKHTTELKSQNDFKYEIGTKYFIWEDLDRKDMYYGDNRIINAQAWYPTKIDSANQPFNKAPYYYLISEASQKLTSWSNEDLEFVESIQTNSFLDAPIAQSSGGFPLIIFSPGLGGNLSQYTYYAEALASEGYFVVGVNHLYESEYVLDKSGKVYPVNNTFHDSLKTLEIPAQITADEYRSTKGIRQKVLGEDLIFCLDKVTEINDMAFEGQIDLTKVGVWGHSIGGAAVVYASYLDSRFSAVINLDGTPPSIALKHGIDQPFLFIEDLTDYDNHQGYAKMHKRRTNFCEKNRNEAYRILIGDINHNSFLDINYHSAANEQDKKFALETLAQTAGYMNLFFEKYLKDGAGILEPVKSNKLEVIVFNK